MAKLKTKNQLLKEIKSFEALSEDTWSATLYTRITDELKAEFNERFLTAMNAKKIMRATNIFFKNAAIAQEYTKWGYILTVERPCTRAIIKNFADALNTAGYTVKPHSYRKDSQMFKGYGMVKVFSKEYTDAVAKLTKKELAMITAAV